jgi:serine/threonine protein kinase
MAQKWYIDRAGVAEGPMTAQELRRRADQGTLRPLDRVSNDRQRWAAARKVRGLTFQDCTPNVLQNTTPVLVVPTTFGVEPHPPEVQVPGYTIEAEIGRGACGVVYRARQVKLERIVALKAVRFQSPSRSTALARFEQEALALAKLSHPNIVNVFDYGHVNGQVFMAMELLEGEDLEHRIRRLGRLDERTVWTIARQTAAALAHAAQFGIIHRDIKPANLYLVPPPTGAGLPGDLPMVKITDFGLAFTKPLGDDPEAPRLTQAGVIVGTPAYMAPEQFSEPCVDHRADIYALGATLFHALTGRPPFDGLSVWDVMLRKNDTVPELSLSVGAESNELVRDMMGVKVHQRVASYEELIRRIDALPCWNEQPPPSRRRRTFRSPRVVAGVLPILLVAVAVVLMGERGPMRALSTPAPAVVAAGGVEMLSDRANFATWKVDGKLIFETGSEGEPVVTVAGEVGWTYRTAHAERLALGIDLHRAESADVVVASTPGSVSEPCLRISRTEGVAVGTVKPDGEFTPLSKVIPYPSANRREGLVPYLSVEILNTGDRWDFLFEGQHLGGYSLTGATFGKLRVRSDGRAVRVERVELERIRLKDSR